MIAKRTYPSNVNMFYFDLIFGLYKGEYYKGNFFSRGSNGGRKQEEGQHYEELEEGFRRKKKEK